MWVVGAMGAMAGFMNDNLDFLEGYMFEAIPSADAVLLKWIIHDLGDEESMKILKRCKEAIPNKEKGD
ncbi:hypothetical protein Q3G72_003426 [Acer saccharum]|nr:hypothetical protein Q3G72_003426 [Acer saccharum]